MIKNVAADKSRKWILIVIFMLMNFICFFFPTTIPYYQPVMFFVCIISLLWLLSISKIDKVNFILWILLSILFLVFTFRFSYLNLLAGIRFGVLIQFLSFFLLTIIIFPKINYKKVYYFIFNLASIVMIFWGLGIVLNIELLKEFTINFYLWGTLDVTIHMINANKPILSFGVHSIAGFFIFQMFILHYYTLNKMKSNYKFHFTIMLLFVILEVYLKSTTSLILTVVMLFILIKAVNNIFLKVMMALVLFISTIIFLGFTDVLYDYVDKLTRGGGLGGITARYASGGLFDMHLSYVNENGYIGFSDIGFIYTTDSGFILNYMRGGLIANIILIFIYARFAILNFKKNIAIYTIIMILIFDSITTLFMYPQVIAFLLLSLIYIKALEDKTCSKH